MPPANVVDYMYRQGMCAAAFKMCDKNHKGYLDKKYIPMFLQDLCGN